MQAPPHSFQDINPGTSASFFDTGRFLTIIFAAASLRTSHLGLLSFETEKCSRLFPAGASASSGATVSTLYRGRLSILLKVTQSSTVARCFHPGSLALCVHKHSIKCVLFAPSTALHCAFLARPFAPPN